MILASLSDDRDGMWLGHYGFDALPKVGETVMLAPDTYEVVSIEHWPVLSSQAGEAAVMPRTKLRIRPLGSSPEETKKDPEKRG